MFHFILLISLTGQAFSRPLYNIAHMVNSVAQIDEYLGYGANAIEADVEFLGDGTAKRFYHGFPCDCWRNCYQTASIDDYINALRDRTNPNSAKFNSRLVLVMFDVKIDGLGKSALSKAGQDFVNKMLHPLYKNNPTQIKVVASVPASAMKEFIVSVAEQIRIIQPDIKNRIGYDIWSTKTWEDTTPGRVLENNLKGIGVEAGHAWLNSGITNCSPKPIFASLKLQVKYIKNTNYFSKVYGWSVDYKRTTKSYFEAGVDGVMANYPDRVEAAIEEMKASKENVWLATLNDNPFSSPR